MPANYLTTTAPYTSNEVYIHKIQHYTTQNMVDWKKNWKPSFIKAGPEEIR
jgi:hypothetical protein